MPGKQENIPYYAVFKHEENRPSGIDSKRVKIKMRFVSRPFKSFALLPKKICIQLPLFRNCMENDQEKGKLFLFAINYTFVAEIFDREQKIFVLSTSEQKVLHRNKFFNVL